MQMIIPHKKSVLSYYDCISSMANIQVNDVNMKNYKSCIGSNDELRCLQWFGMESLAKLRETIEIYGSWPEGVLKGSALMDVIKAPDLPSVRRKKSWGARGSRLSITKLYNGKINRMYRSVKKEISEGRRNKRQPVNIVIDLTAGAKTHSDSYFWRGALGVVLAKELMKSGRSVRILAGCSIRNFSKDSNYRGRRNFTCLLNVKPYGESVDYNKLFALTGLAGIFRYYFFKSIFALNTPIRDRIGSVCSLDEEMLAPVVDNNTTIIIENVWNEQSALIRAKDILGNI